MNTFTKRGEIAGPVGPLSVAVDTTTDLPTRGLAVICHPHPLQGGTMDNKVVTTVARALVQRGWRVVRFNYRGVGDSAGTWDEGRGEVDDALAVVADFRARAADPSLPFMLAGFSFGAYVAAAAASRLPEGGKAARLVLVGASTEKQQVPPVPADTVVIHGETDDVVPLAATFDWARPQSIPVIVFPGVGHFFHGQLGLLKTVVVRQLQAS
ncbi:MAG: alpha/beta hydrolase [Caldimonas sp.]